MLAIYSDTHGTDDHELEGAALEAAREADRVIHAGDFKTERALEAFREECATLHAVHGNVDSAAVRERLPGTLTVEHDGLRIAVTHRHESGETGLATFGRASGADLVVSGHSHRPALVETDDLVLCNPGSHAQPRGNRPGFAIVEREADGDAFVLTLQEPDGTGIETALLET